MTTWFFYSRGDQKLQEKSRGSGPEALVGSSNGMHLEPTDRFADAARIGSMDQHSAFVAVSRKNIDYTLLEMIHWRSFSSDLIASFAG